MDIVDIVFESIVKQEIEDTGRKFTEKEVADIISVVAIMVGDPMPGANKDLYMKLIKHMNLPEHLFQHLMTAVMSSRMALKECLGMVSPQESRSEVGDLISNLMQNINVDSETE